MKEQLVAEFYEDLFAQQQSHNLVCLVLADPQPGQHLSQRRGMHTRPLVRLFDLLLRSGLLLFHHYAAAGQVHVIRRNCKPVLGHHAIEGTIEKLSSHFALFKQLLLIDTADKRIACLKARGLRDKTFGKLIEGSFGDQHIAPNDDFPRCFVLTQSAFQPLLCPSGLVNGMRDTQTTPPAPNRQQAYAAAVVSLAELGQKRDALRRPEASERTNIHYQTTADRGYRGELTDDEPVARSACHGKSAAKLGPRCFARLEFLAFVESHLRGGFGGKQVQMNRTEMLQAWHSIQ